jgi:hypothetical protein
MTDKEFLSWVADRLVHVYGESESVDFVHKLRKISQRKPLTDEGISDLWCKVSNTDFVTADTHVFARAIEAAHGIKVKT